jgi:hypothetical protein
MGRTRPTRLYCGTLCRRRYFHGLEQAAIAQERREQIEPPPSDAYEERVYGKREAARRAKDRARLRSIRWGAE